MCMFFCRIHALMMRLCIMRICIMRICFLLLYLEYLVAHLLHWSIMCTWPCSFFKNIEMFMFLKYLYSHSSTECPSKYANFSFLSVNRSAIIFNPAYVKLSMLVLDCIDHPSGSGDYEMKHWPRTHKLRDMFSRFVSKDFKFLNDFYPCVLSIGSTNF